MGRKVTAWSRGILSDLDDILEEIGEYLDTRETTVDLEGIYRKLLVVYGNIETPYIAEEDLEEALD